MRIVNFGAGDSGRPGHINIDGSATVLLSMLPLPAKLFGSRSGFIAGARGTRLRYRKARDLDFPERSLDGFYASHVLEHLDREECKALLAQIRRWLKPDGVLRVVLPDLKLIANDYFSGAIDADEFVSQTHLADRLSRFSLNRHYWMYDFESFARLLFSVGYASISRCEFGQGAIPEMTSLDLESRRNESFYVEAH